MSKDLVQRQFGTNAANYVTSGVHAKGASLSRLVDLVAAKRNWHALDIATGGGHVALALSPQVAKVTASDLTPEMLVQVDKQIAEKQITNIVTCQADAEALPFDEASFDLVTCRIAPHHFPSIPKFVSEVARVLKPGGVFGLVDNVAPDAHTNPEFSASELADAAATYNQFERTRDPSHNLAWTTTQWLECIKTAGLEITQFDLVAKPMSFDAWINNMSVPANLVPGLAAMLNEASPAFRAYIQPSEVDGKLGFTIAELVLAATTQD